MSLLAQSRPNWAVRAMSGLPSLPTELRTSRVVCLVPSTEVESFSLDHLVSAREQAGWNCEIECFCGLKVDRKLISGRRLYRKVGGPFAFKDAIDIAGGASVNVDGVRAVGSQTSVRRIVWKRIYCSQPAAQHRFDKQRAVRHLRRAGGNDYTAVWFSGEGC